MITQEIRQRIAGKLRKTAGLLTTLPPKNFRYDHFVLEYDMKDKIQECGTVACAAGWYPVWYGENCGLKYGLSSRTEKMTLVNFADEDSTYDIDRELRKFHELNDEGPTDYYHCLVDVLFYGYALVLNEKTILRNYQSKLEEATTIEVAKRFDTVADLIQSGKLDQCLEPAA